MDKVYTQLPPCVVRFNYLRDDKLRKAQAFFELLVLEQTEFRVSGDSMFRINAYLIHDSTKPWNHPYRGELPTCLKASYCSVENKVKLVLGGIFVDPDFLRGNHVGTWLFNRIVLWAKQFSTATVASIDEIGENFTNWDKLREVRLKFYRQFGLTVHESPHSWAHTEPMPVSELKTVSSLPNVNSPADLRIYLDDLLEDYYKTKQELASCKYELQQTRACIATTQHRPASYEHSLLFKIFERLRSFLDR